MRGITIDSKHSYNDYDCIIVNTEYGSIKKKLIRATVPYSDIVYDFSELNNTENFEEQEIKYTFEFTILNKKAERSYRRLQDKNYFKHLKQFYDNNKSRKNSSMLYRDWET